MCLSARPNSFPVRSSVRPSRQWIWTAALLSLGVAAGGTAQAGYSFHRIADTAGKFSNFEVNPSINNDGVVVFLGYFDFDLGAGSGIFTSDGVVESERVRTGPRFFALGGGVAINDSGTVAFRGYVGSFFQSGIFSVGNTGIVSTVALNDTPFSDFGASPNINNRGTVAFYANRALGGVLVGSGIYAGDGAGYTSILERDATWGIASAADINADGTVTGTLVDPAKDVFVYDGSGGSYAAQTSAGSLYKALDTVPSINDRGAIAYVATLRADDSQVVKLHPSGELEREVAATGGDGSFTVFNYPVVNNNDQVAFLAGFGTAGIGIFTGSDIDADSVIKTGDDLFSAKVKEVRLSQGGFNDNGEIAFYYRMTDNHVGIAVASPGQLTRSIPTGKSYAGIRLRSDLGSGLTAKLLGGLAGTARSVELSFAAKSDLPASGLVSPIGEALNLSGTGSDLFVLQLSYSDDDLVKAGITDESQLLIRWLDPADKALKNAVLGNTPAGGTPHFGTSYTTYLASQAGVPKLGDYGNSPGDNTIWAVLNHNSVFVAGAAVAAGAPDGSPFTTIADITTANPLGGGVFSGFANGDYLPALEGGLVVFVGGNSAHSGTPFLAPAAGGPSTSLIGNRQPVPGEPSVPTPTGGFSLDGTAVAYVGVGSESGVVGGPLLFGIFQKPASGPFTSVANAISVIPDYGGSFVNSSYSSPSADGGRVAFWALSSSGSRAGIYLTTPTGLRAVANNFTTIPGRAGTFPGGFSPNPYLDAGDVVFAAQMRPSGPTEGIFKTTSAGAGPLETVVDYTVTVPGSPEQFSTMALPVMSGGHVSFWGRTGSFKSGIYTTVGGSIQVVADQKTAIPGATGNFIDFDNNYSLAMKGDRVVFLGFGDNSLEGIYLWEAGTLRKLVDSNDVIDGRGVRHLEFGREGFDGTGLVFSATFDGAYFQGIYTMAVAPGSGTSGRPILTIGQTATDSLRLSWPATVVGAHLEATTTLLPGSWSAVATPVTVVNGENVVNEPRSTPTRYFRLHLP